MTESIYTEVAQDLRRARDGWDAFRARHHHAPYHDPDASATPAPEASMSVLDTLRTDYDEVLAKVKEFGETKIPAALSDVQKLEGNPVVDALLSAVHVPSEALSMVVNVIEGLEDLYKPETETPAPSEPTAPADPATGEPPAQPEPAPAPA